MVWLEASVSHDDKGDTKTQTTIEATKTALQFHNFPLHNFTVRKIILNDPCTLVVQHTPAPIHLLRDN